ncbi:peptidyl-prolyl cis-trans isomerase [Pendulispora albinea]|uniref:Peptidyl-prolyl cis-trans isomerase n=1 Tax=Pendulispora albinea TaxID=2741071 RepID=A0ABZ2M757_9BACT
MIVHRFLREPLVHFALIGAALFATERRWRPAERAAVEQSRTMPARIEATDDVRRGLTEEHIRTHGRPPTPSETNALVAAWIDDEVLFREGLVRGLDKDDPRVHQRVVEKMSFVLEQGITPAAPTEEELSAWFNAHSSKWAQPELVDFTQVFVQGDGAPAQERARGMLAELEKGANPAGLGDTFSGGRRYRRRKIADLGESFGPDFSAGLAEQKEGRWALRRSRFGFHLVRVDRRTPAERPSLSQVREEVALDFQQAHRAEKMNRAIAELRKRWPVEKAP